MTLELLIFDLDGTLIDSKADIVRSVNFALQREGFPCLPAKAIENFVGRGLLHLIRDALGKDSETEAQRVAETFCEHYLEHLLDQTTLYPGILEFLKSNSHLQKAVVSNKPYAFSKKILEGLNIHGHFSWVIGGDSLSVQKPSPEVFEPIFRSFSRKPKGLMVGDSKIDIDCGKAAGLLTCGVTYGFRPKEEVARAQPDFLIDHFSQLQNLSIFS